MLRCTECRPLILDHLFGLLDAPEVAAVAAHLATCPACAAEREEAAKVHGLIAKAAKIAFPAVRFEAPDAARPAAAKAAAPTRTLPVPVVPMAAPVSVDDGRLPVVPAAPKKGSDSGRYKKTPAAGSWAGRIIPWAVAAAVLLAVPGTVVPVLDLLHGAEVARRDADASSAQAAEALRAFEERHAKVDQERAATRVALAAAKQAHDGVLAKWVAEEKAAALAQDTRKLTWQVLKPAAVQPGAPNEFLLVVDQRGTTAGGRVVAEIRDQTDAVIHSQPIAHDRTPQHPIRLPADAWTKLKPDSELFLVVSQVDERTHEKIPLQDKVKLLGPVFATVLTTDKPTYWPGETVRFRSLTLDRVTFTPPAREQVLRYELRSPAGTVVRMPAPLQGSTDLVRVVEGRVEPVKGPDGKPLRGVGTGEFALPADAPEGDYTLTMQELPSPSGDPAVVPFPVSRTIRVEAGVPEVLNKRVAFAAASYSAGDAVEAWVDVRYQDKPLAGARVVSAVATIDDQTLELPDVPATDAAGRAHLRFTLPAAVARGDARLRVWVQARADGREVEESVAARVPVVGPNVTVEFFPEGGDLVAGVPCRVYVRATTPTGLPVEIAGIVTDGRRTLATVETLRTSEVRGANRGLGAFQFTPELGTPVWLKLAAPAGAYAPVLVLPENTRFPTPPAALIGAPLVAASRTGFLLPEPKQGGVVMAVLDPVTAPGKPVRVHLRSVGRERKLVVGAYTRGRLADTKTVTAPPEQVTEVQLLAGGDSRGGVVRVTVFEEPEQFPGQPREDLKPVAERLVFRKPGEGLNLSFTTSGPRADGAAGFAPNAAVGLNVTAADEKGRPAAAVLYAAVVNSAVAADPKARSLATHFLIAGEVNTPDALEYADFLLTDHPLAGESLDLVLGTQGWRRFAEQVPHNYARRPVAPTQEQANLLVCNGQYMTAVEPPAFRDHQKIRDAFWPRYEAAVRALDAAKAAAETADADRNGAEGVQRYAAEANAAQKAARAERERAERAAAPVERFRETGWFAVGGFGLLAVMLGGACLARPQGRLPLGVGTVGAVGLVAFLVVALGTAERTLAAGASVDAVQWKQARVAEEARDAEQPTPTADPNTEVAAAGTPGAADRFADRVARKSTPAAKDEQSVADGKQPAKPFAGGLGGGAGGGGGTVAPPVLPRLGAAAPAPVPPGGGYGGPKGLQQGPMNGTVPPGIALAPAQTGGGRADGAVVGPAPSAPARSPAAPTATPADKPGTAMGNKYGALEGGLFGLPQRDAAGKGYAQTLGEGGWQPKTKNRQQAAIGDAELNDGGYAFRLRSAAPAAETDPPKDQAQQERRANLRRAAPVWKQDEKSAKAAAEAKEQARKSDAEYQQAVEKAKQVADKRARELQNHIQDGLARQLKEAEQLNLNKASDRADANAALAAAAPQAGGPSRGFVAVPAEARAAYRVGASVPTAHPLVVREYAAPRPTAGEADRGTPDEADTVMWQPVVVVPATGRLTLPVQLGSARGGYEVVVAGHTLDGRVGAVRGIIPVAPPAQDDPNLPVPPK